MILFSVYNKSFKLLCNIKIENMLPLGAYNLQPLFTKFNEKEIFQLSDLCFTIISRKNKYKQSKLVTQESQYKPKLPI